MDQPKDAGKPENSFCVQVVLLPSCQLKLFQWGNKMPNKHSIAIIVPYCQALSSSPPQLNREVTHSPVLPNSPGVQHPLHFSLLKTSCPKLLPPLLAYLLPLLAALSRWPFHECTAILDGTLPASPAGW